jgi:hypothetical protein
MSLSKATTTAGRRDAGVAVRCGGFTISVISFSLGMIDSMPSLPMITV